MPYESVSALDRPHRLAASDIWEIPVGRGRRFGESMPRAFDAAIGGWQLGAVVNAGFNRNSQQQLASDIRTFPLRFSGIRGDDQRKWDFSIVKNFALRGERVKMRFRADVYNAWNQTNFNNPNITPTNSAFGRVTGAAGDARNWQLGLKLEF